MKNLICLAMLWLSLIVESTVFQVPPMKTIQPDLVLVCIVLVALVRGPRTGLILGICIGFIQDVNFASFIGLSAFLYGVVGYFSGAAFQQFLHKNLPITLFVTVFFTFVVQWVSYGLTRMFGVTAYSWQTVLSHSLFETIVNGVALVLLYPWCISLFTDRVKRKYSSVR